MQHTCNIDYHCVKNKTFLKISLHTTWENFKTHKKKRLMATLNAELNRDINHQNNPTKELRKKKLSALFCTVILQIQEKGGKKLTCCT